MNPMQISDNQRENYYVFLDNLQESEVCNMFGAAAYLRDEFPELDKNSSNKILADWMNSYDERHPEN